MKKQKNSAQLRNPVFTDAELVSYTKPTKILRFYISDFFNWWYIQMPIIYMIRLQRIVRVLNDQLSFTLLLRTFFSPWKKDKRFVAYVIGITVRIFYLPIAGIIILLAALLSIVFLFTWILLPILSLFMALMTPFTL